MRQKKSARYFYDSTDNTLARTFRKMLRSCMNNRGRLQFVLRGILEHHPISSWGPATSKAFLCLLRGNDPERIYRNTTIAVTALKNCSVETRLHLMQLIDEAIAAHQHEQPLRVYDPKRTPPHRKFTMLDRLQVLRDEIEGVYGPINEIRAAA